MMAWYGGAVAPPYDSLTAMKVVRISSLIVLLTALTSPLTAAAGCEPAHCCPMVSPPVTAAGHCATTASLLAPSDCCSVDSPVGLNEGSSPRGIHDDTRFALLGGRDLPMASSGLQAVPASRTLPSALRPGLALFTLHSSLLL